MRVLITGAAGYLGAKIVEKLVSAKIFVRALDIRPKPSWAPGRDQGVMWVPGASAAFAHQYLLGVDAVIPLAAVVGSPKCAADPDQAKALNVDSIRTLVAAAKGRRFIYLTTESGYVPDVDGSVCESSRFNEKEASVYAKTKRAAERLILDTPTGASLRLGSVYGVSPTMRWDNLVHAILRDWMQTSVVRVKGPTERRPLISIDDVASAVLWMLQGNPHAIGPFCFAEHPIRTKREIGRIVASTVGASKVEEVDGKDPDGRDFRLSTDRIEAHGYRRPVSSLHVSLSDIWWRARDGGGAA